MTRDSNIYPCVDRVFRSNGHHTGVQVTTRLCNKTKAIRSVGQHHAQGFFFIALDACPPLAYYSSFFSLSLHFSSWNYSLSLSRFEIDFFTDISYRGFSFVMGKKKRKEKIYTWYHYRGTIEILSLMELYKDWLILIDCYRFFFRRIEIFTKDVRMKEYSVERSSWREVNNVSGINFI